MGRILCITGTGTEVGKTALSLAILLWARERKLRASYLKIVQCGSRRPDFEPFLGDADWIDAAVPDAFSASAIYTFSDPVSPHLAAERAGAWIDPVWILQQAAATAQRCDLAVIEGAGGAAAPLTRAGLSLADLAAQGKWPCLIASLPGLGALHHTVATAAFLVSRGAAVAGFAMRQDQPMLPAVYEDNRATLASLLEAPWFGTLPFCSGLEKRLPLPPALGLHFSQAMNDGLTQWWKTP